MTKPAVRTKMPLFRLHALLAGTAGILAGLLAGDALAEKKDQRPNIIFIMADDLGYGDLGCYGQTVIQTPHLDRMAQQGVRFTDFYAGATVCRPSRLVLWTGQHTGHTAIDSNQPHVLQEEDVTVARLLQQAGYRTGAVGKWALGNVENTGHPNRQGFDFWFGYLDQHDAHNYYPEFLWRNSEKVRLPGNRLGPKPQVSVQRETYSHDMITDHALEFIGDHARDERPFLLHIHWTIPHANNERGAAVGDGMEVPDYGIYDDRDWPGPEKGHAAMITRMDSDVGRILKRLEQLELNRKTLVLFTSDNGPHQEGGHKHAFFDSNGPLRGIKRDLYEGGIRVPLIAWWPGTVPAGSVTGHVSAFWDFLPTACELADIKDPPACDGISFVPTLQGKNDQPSHASLYWGYQGKAAVRMGRFKAVRPAGTKAVELYDLANDIGEASNVAEEHPQILESAERIMAARGEVR